MFFPDSRALEMINKNRRFIKINSRFEEEHEIDPEWINYFRLFSKIFMKKIPSNFKLIFIKIEKKNACFKLIVTVS